MVGAADDRGGHGLVRELGRLPGAGRAAGRDAVRALAGEAGPETYAYDVRVASSRDGGETWSSPVVPHRDGTQTEHGFVSMTPWLDGTMGIVWLDGRKTAGATHAAHGEAGAEMSLVHTTLDRHGKLGAETVLDGRVCDCCQTDVVRAGDTMVVVYRDRSEKEVRDISVVRFANGRWSAPRPVAHDGWEIKRLPGERARRRGRRHERRGGVVHRRGGQTDVKVAFSDDSGASFGARSSSTMAVRWAAWTSS